jgi:NADPH:quinone reductase-like Zn-dependent oxidoreductase
VEIDIFRLLRKQAWITGTHFAPKATIRTALDLLAEKRLRPVLARSFPLVEAGEAQALLESREFFGNILLEIDP